MEGPGLPGSLKWYKKEEGKGKKERERQKEGKKGKGKRKKGTRKRKDRKGNQHDERGTIQVRAPGKKTSGEPN